MRWCPSLLDWQSHLVGARGCPGGALQAVCGQWLLAGRPCQRCAQHATGIAGAEELALASAAELAYGEVLRERERLRGHLRELAAQAPNLTGEQLRHRLLLLARVADAPPEAEQLTLADASIEDLGRRLGLLGEGTGEEGASRPVAETVTVRLPADELYNLQPLPSVVIWWCRLCASQGKATTQPLARSGAIEHLAAEHRATIDYTNDDHQ